MAAIILPQDLITEHILTRLPSKSIGRFRCVSKEWLSLLTQPHFIRSHQNTLNTNRFIFESLNHDEPVTSHQKTLTRMRYIVESSDEDASFPCYNHESVSTCYNHEEAVSSTLTKFRFGLDLHNFEIDGSVNGLVLANGYKTLNRNAFTRLILNPTTKDYVLLPIPCHEKLLGMNGFGYDSVSGDYKIVFISIHHEFYGNVYVYNLRTTTWKQVTSSPYYHNFNSTSWSGVLVNGFLHWIVPTCGSKQVIVAFSLADEKLSEVPLPIVCNEVAIISKIDTKLVAFGDKLAIFNEVKGDVWLMNEYGVQTSWTKIIRGFNGIPMYKPIVFSDNGKVVFLTGDLVWTYDVEERTFSESVDISHMKIRYFIGAYAESLVSPKFS